MSSLTNNQKSCNSVPVEQMISYILKQINDISESDIKVMKPNEIVSIYNQLINENAHQTQQVNLKNQIIKDKYKTNQTDLCNYGVPQDSKQAIDESSKQILKQSKQSQINQNSIVKINGSNYYVPECLSRESYNIANKRYTLICRVEPHSMQQKRRLVSQSISPNMSSTIKALKDQQIEQTYENLKIVNRSQRYLSFGKNEHQQPQIRQFIVYQKKQFISQEQKSQLQNSLQKQNKNEKKNNQEIIIQQSSVQSQNNICKRNNEFWNEDFDKKKDKQRQQKEKNNQNKKLDNQLTIKQAIKFVKNKDKKENSVQTDQIKSIKNKTKSKITVVSQVQYIDNNDNNSITQNNQKSHNIDINEQIKPGITPRKIRINNTVHPQDLPDPSIIKWINSMKSLLIKLEYEYLNQFKSNWVVINE